MEFMDKFINYLKFNESFVLLNCKFQINNTKFFISPPGYGKSTIIFNLLTKSFQTDQYPSLIVLNNLNRMYYIEELFKFNNCDNYKILNNSKDNIDINLKKIYITTYNYIKKKDIHQIFQRVIYFLDNYKLIDIKENIKSFNKIIVSDVEEFPLPNQIWANIKLKNTINLVLSSDTLNIYTSKRQIEISKIDNLYLDKNYMYILLNKNNNLESILNYFEEVLNESQTTRRKSLFYMLYLYKKLYFLDSQSYNFNLLEHRLNEENNCVICLEHEDIIKNNKFYIIDCCYNLICNNCINEYIIQKNSCPCCRKEITNLYPNIVENSNVLENIVLDLIKSDRLVVIVFKDKKNISKFISENSIELNGRYSFIKKKYDIIEKKQKNIILVYYKNLYKLHLLKITDIILFQLNNIYPYISYLISPWNKREIINVILVN